jgi:DNA-binding beta-propeller fold protein YncE
MIKGYFLLPLVLFVSCVKDKPTSVVQEFKGSGGARVYVINEGGFSHGNASVSLYDPETGEVAEDIYRSQNLNAPGDVAQSMELVNKRLYLVMNNSAKIVICDRQLKKISAIENLHSPRYVCVAASNKAYVSSFGDEISVINPLTETKTGTIRLPGWSERMLKMYQYVYVTNIRRPYVYLINAFNDQLTDSIETGINAGALSPTGTVRSGYFLQEMKPRPSKQN